MVKIYYGMSGTLKLTKLKSEVSERDVTILSNIKPHLRLSTELLGKTPLDTDFALERLIQYTSIPENTQGDVLVERGITDFLESWTSTEENKDLRDSGDFIRPWTDKELCYLGERGPIVRELLVMLDEDFIRNKVLSEPSRQRRFPDIETYLKRQSEYVEFTRAWNSIDYVTEILDAEKFIKTLKN